MSIPPRAVRYTPPPIFSIYFRSLRFPPPLTFALFLFLPSFLRQQIDHGTGTGNVRLDKEEGKGENPEGDR